jgi:hypothetical protein
MTRRKNTQAGKNLDYLISKFGHDLVAEFLNVDENFCKIMTASIVVKEATYKMRELKNERT